MERPKKTVADKTTALANSFPKHPLQDEFLTAAVKLRAEDLADTTDDPMASARVEFEAAINAIIYPPTESRFYFVWASDDQARLLTNFTQTAWANSDGEYGEHQPVHFQTKQTKTQQ